MMDVDQTAAKELFSSASKGNLEQVDNQLTKLKVPIDCVDLQSQTALHYACANDQPKIVRHLIKKGAPLEYRNWCGWTPILLAACYGYTDVMNLLLQNNAKVCTENDRAVSALTCAARFGKIQIVQSLLEHGAEIIPNSDGKREVYVTPLMAAAQHGYIEIVDLLLQYNNKATDYGHPDSGYTALMISAANGHLEIVKMLLEKGGADANLENTAHQTAYNLSIIKKRHNVAEYLKNRTERRVKYPSSEHTLLDAAKSNNIELVRKHLKHKKIDVNMCDEDGATPLLFACVGGNVEMVKLLLDNGANTDVQDYNHGWTPLMQSTLKRQVDVIILLLKHNADISIKNNDKLTAFDLATRVGMPEITRLLAPNAHVTFDRVEDLERKMKGSKESWISKVQSKIGINKRAGQTFSRVPVQIQDINDNEEPGELKKTSSALSIFDAKKAMSGLAKARITLLSPQVVLPDDVVAPTLPPFSKLPGFDLPKMPIVSTGLSSSNGSNTEWSPKNSSDDSTSLKALLPNMGSKKTRNLKRPQKEISNIPIPSPVWEPDSPQSSMTSSGFTSISQCQGPAVMPKQFKKDLSPTFTERIDFQNISGFSKRMSLQQAIPKQKKKSTSIFPHINNLSIKYNETDNIESLLHHLSLEDYHSNFEEEGVDFETLKEMDDDDLKLMGIDKTVNRDRILDIVGKKSRSRRSSSKTRSIHDVIHANSVYQPSPPPNRPPSRDVFDPSDIKPLYPRLDTEKKLGVI